MASYFQYLKGNSVQITQQTPPSVNSSTGSTWSDTLSSRLTTLRKALTNTSEQDDPDFEDSSHVSNVLRAYYTEKGRPFPPWLPPDPKKPAVATPLPIQYGNTYGGYGANQYGNEQPGSRNSGGRGSGLSDLWDTSPAQPAAPPQPQSLRGPRFERPVPQSLQSHTSSNSANSLGPSSSQSAARPLPSQRFGSHQNVQTGGSPVGGVGGRDRLRAKFQAGGSGRNSPQPTATGGATPAYGQSVYSSGGSYSSQGEGGSPYVSASQPWSSNGGDDGFTSGYGADVGYGAGGAGDRRQGFMNRPRPGGPR